MALQAYEQPAEVPQYLPPTQALEGQRAYLMLIEHRQHKPWQLALWNLILPVQVGRLIQQP